MIISYDGPPDFKSKTITIKIELHPDEVAPVVARLLDTTLTPPPEPVSDEITDARVRLLDQLARFVRHRPELASWLCQVGRALKASEPWPEPPQ